MEINREPGADGTELRELKDLVAEGLAQDPNRARLNELEQSVVKQKSEVASLQRQLEDASPFFMDDGFKSEWRTKSTVETVKVTVVTAPHTTADTRNYVYFRTGGHKYLLGSAVAPLSPDLGPQEFTLDLVLT